ncbi:SITS-binding protein-like [Protopterus annectens]|uniref:SITS-binding protein-like n=1 Tax=Protopterus annectens TaxID=7888 RepID=UPI001CFB56DE|nr:SITS-binding protein-like [Protopterus annectens]
MPHTRTRKPNSVPDANWDSGLKEMNETWKGTIACLGVAIFFVMTIGIIYWQVMDQPNKNWVIKGSLSGLIWERSTHSLIIQTLTEDKTFVEINVGNFPNMEVPFVKNLCFLNKTDFCYTWDVTTDLKISFEPNYSAGTECYSINWTPLHCQVKLKDCFSMSNISWYGGASVSAQQWPLNNITTESQPFVVSNLRDVPNGYGSVLERYFLGSTGVAVLIAPDVPVHVSIESNKHFCLQTPPSSEQIPLQYTVCVGENIKSVHQEVGCHLYDHQQRMIPNINILWLPLWRTRIQDSSARLEKEFRSLSKRLKKHGLEEGVIAVNEHSTMLLSTMDNNSYLRRRKSISQQKQELQLIKHLIITLSPYMNIDSEKFQTSLKKGKENYWLSLHSDSKGYLAPLLMKWKTKLSVQLNITNAEAVHWFLTMANELKENLGAEYVILEGGEENVFLNQAIHPPKALKGDKYLELLAEVATELGNSTIISAGTRSSYQPLFIQMTQLQSDWSYAGLKGIIPCVLHYSLLGYNFFIPDTIGGSLGNEHETDEELFIRWLEIVTFLPVMSFSTPTWIFGDEQTLNLTRMYIQKHQDFVAPLIVKYAEEWTSLGKPIFRPLWWISPNKPVSFTTDDAFLIGDEVLIAPITEKGKVSRDIYLPGDDYKWMDLNTAQVFDGGTLLKNYSISLNEIAVFRKTL